MLKFDISQNKAIEQKSVSNFENSKMFSSQFRHYSEIHVTPN